MREVDGLDVVGHLEVELRHPSKGKVTKQCTASLYQNLDENKWVIITCASNFKSYSKDDDKEFFATRGKFYLQRCGDENLAEFQVIQFTCHPDFDPSEK